MFQKAFPPLYRSNIWVTNPAFIGGFWTVNNDVIKRYCCHVGNSYTEENLLLKQSESLEATFWVALRLMEERYSLLNKISEEEKKKS